MASTRTDQVLDLASEAGVLRARDLETRGIPRANLQRLLQRGVLQRSGRGLYVLADADITENHTLAEAAKRVPAGVICLLSALRFHDLTTQNPRSVWMAIHPKDRLPRVDYPPLRIVRFSGRALGEGVELHNVEGVLLRVYSVAKTVADCFRYRNKIGLDVAMEALQEAWRSRRCTMDELWRYAAVDRVANVMRPYLESVV